MSGRAEFIREIALASAILVSPLKPLTSMLEWSNFFEDFILRLSSKGLSSFVDWRNCRSSSNWEFFKDLVSFIVSCFVLGRAKPNRT